ncbi:hypothetical protein B0H19DRAFT_1226436 [Mycena capillaripes]|nr:hypothetical protein B0H19DRAFT_1226436 [Mycena capillaripes]
MYCIVEGKDSRTSNDDSDAPQIPDDDNISERSDEGPEEPAPGGRDGPVRLRSPHSSSDEEEESTRRTKAKAKAGSKTAKHTESVKAKSTATSSNALRNPSTGQMTTLTNESLFCTTTLFEVHERITKEEIRHTFKRNRARIEKGATRLFAACGFPRFNSNPDISGCPQTLTQANDSADGNRNGPGAETSVPSLTLSASSEDFSASQLANSGKFNLVILGFDFLPVKAATAESDGYVGDYI